MCVLCRGDKLFFPSVKLTTIQESLEQKLDGIQSFQSLLTINFHTNHSGLTTRKPLTLVRKCSSEPAKKKPSASLKSRFVPEPWITCRSLSVSVESKLATKGRDANLTHYLPVTYGEYTRSQYTYFFQYKLSYFALINVSASVSVIVVSYR